jgi:hypothetical protein
MDFSAGRGPQPQTVAPASHSAGGSSKKLKDQGQWARIATLVLVAAVAILLIFVVIFLASGSNTTKSEDKYVDTSKLQAVFLNTGQVYFGNIKTLNSSYVVLTNIYYLQTSNSGSGSNSNTSVSLVKLGCELHEPYDQMVINRSQVTFWENLQDNGQVAKAVKTFQQQNPNGQKCSDQSSSSPSTSSSVQNAPTNSTPSTSTGTSKP